MDGKTIGALVCTIGLTILGNFLSMRLSEKITTNVIARAFDEALKPKEVTHKEAEDALDKMSELIDSMNKKNK